MPLKTGACMSQISIVWRFTHVQKQCVLKLCLCKLQDIVMFVIVYRLRILQLIMIDNKD